MKNLKNERGIGLVPFILVFVTILVIAGIVVGVVIINKNLNKQPITASEFKDIMEDKYNLAREILRKYNQEHLLMFYDELNDNQKEKLLNQILSIDFNRFYCYTKEKK